METIMMHKNEITAFIVGGKIYRVIGTDHALERLWKRHIDPYHIASACLALGNKLVSYNDSGQQIMIIDSGKNLSTLITVENYTIVIVTVLDKSNPYVKENTVIESFKIG